LEPLQIGFVLDLDQFEAAAAFDQVIWRVASVAAFVLEIEGDRLGADPG
jgi:hypothetical protein